MKLSANRLICPVRNCGLVLARQDRRVVCPAGHSFDIARSGYINLLQPQDKKSKRPGDTAAAVSARTRLHASGVTEPLAHGIIAMAAASEADTVLDVGCGDGFYLAHLTQSAGCEAHGVDLSIPAVDFAAKRDPGIEWIVANADRAIPYADASFSLVMSITARMNPPEFRRVLRHGGRLLIALPAPGDLVEVRGSGRDRTERTIADFSSHFRLISQGRTSTSAELDEVAIEDIRHAVYRPLQPAAARAMRVTFSLDLLLFTPAS